MSTLAQASAPRQVRIVAEFSSKRKHESEFDLTLDTLALLTPNSPLSRMFLDGAGEEFMPKAIAVYVDGKLVWRKRCPKSGDTAVIPTSGHQGDKRIRTISLDGERVSAKVERMLRNRAYAQYRSERRAAVVVSHEAAEDFVADVLEAAGSLRPKLAPRPAEVEPAVDHGPYPLPVYGAPATPDGYNYRPSCEYRLVALDADKAGPGVRTRVKLAGCEVSVPNYAWEFRT